MLYGEAGHEVAVRAELHRLREILGAALATRPYRLVGIDTDLSLVRQRLAADDANGSLNADGPLNVDGSLNADPGPLLPRSVVPAIVAARRALADAVRPPGEAQPADDLGAVHPLSLQTTEPV
jgi:hypothetical protein